MTMRLQNQGKAKIHFGNKPNDVFHPNAVGVFDEDTGKNLLKLYPHVIDIDRIAVNFDSGAISDFTKEKTANAAAAAEDEEAAAAAKPQTPAEKRAATIAAKKAAQEAEDAAAAAEDEEAAGGAGDGAGAQEGEE